MWRLHQRRGAPLLGWAGLGALLHAAHSESSPLPHPCTVDASVRRAYDHYILREPSISHPTSAGDAAAGIVGLRPIQTTRRAGVSSPLARPQFTRSQCVCRRTRLHASRHCGWYIGERRGRATHEETWMHSFRSRRYSRRLLHRRAVVRIDRPTPPPMALSGSVQRQGVGGHGGAYVVCG